MQVLPTRGSGDWRSNNATPSKGTTFRVPNLIEGADYEFRVVAVNDAGPGKPSKSTGKHTVRDPICEKHLLLTCTTISSKGKDNYR